MIPLAKCNTKKLSKINKPKPSKPLLSFLAALNTLIDHNIFEQDLCHKYEQKANVILRKKQCKVQLAQYLHATYLSPTSRTLIQAIKNNHFISWPGLTVDLIKKHLPKSIATLRGHMTSERQGLQSMKVNLIEDLNTKDIQEDFFSSSDSPNIKTKSICYALI